MLALAGRDLHPLDPVKRFHRLISVPPLPRFPSAITMSALSSPFLRFFEISSHLFSFFERNTPSTPKSGLRWFLCWPSRGDQGSLVIFRSASIRPIHLFDQNFDHDYLFKLPLQGAGCPFTWSAFYCPPLPIPSSPACEPNSSEGEYSQPFRHIQYKRAPILRPIATLAMFRCRRMARCR